MTPLEGIFWDSRAEVRTGEGFWMTVQYLNVSSFIPSLLLRVFSEIWFILCPLSISASMTNMAKIEEMERLLREAQAEKQRLLEHRVLSPNLVNAYV